MLMVGNHGRHALRALSACLALAVVTAVAAHGQNAQSVQADVAFAFDCKDGTEPTSSDKIQHFLESQHFRVLNKVRLARERRIRYPFTLDIVAIDENRREITFTGFPVSPGTYYAGLYSPPPTRHASDLENSLLE